MKTLLNRGLSSCIFLILLSFSSISYGQMISPDTLPQHIILKVNKTEHQTETGLNVTWFEKDSVHIEGTVSEIIKNGTATSPTQSLQIGQTFSITLPCLAPQPKPGSIKPDEGELPLPTETVIPEKCAVLESAKSLDIFGSVDGKILRVAYSNVKN